MQPHRKTIQKYFSKCLTIQQYIWQNQILICSTFPWKLFLYSDPKYLFPLFFLFYNIQIKHLSLLVTINYHSGCLVGRRVWSNRWILSNGRQRWPRRRLQAIGTHQRISTSARQSSVFVLHWISISRTWVWLFKIIRNWRKN